ncbi:hypothetical protein H4R18_001866 [Coemansia javaensis]|uniref:Zn(2)-C6 fungal-type domain-containing protein n=1 Tax=Coemansia javaensis TaxID=2761396 RepID=A0A9W8HDT4_9FUNG|nr:hypothetical protein H4R18_001866 [Coemansia javaensis]
MVIFGPPAESAGWDCPPPPPPPPPLQLQHHRAGGYAAGPAPAHPAARTNSDISDARRYRPYPEIAAAPADARYLPAAAAAAAAAGPPAGGIGHHHLGAMGMAMMARVPRRSRHAGDAQKRRRRTQACEYCHMKKIKCEGDGAHCQNCIKNDVRCVWGQKRKRGPKPKAAVALAQRIHRHHHQQQQQMHHHHHHHHHHHPFPPAAVGGNNSSSGSSISSSSGSTAVAAMSAAMAAAAAAAPVARELPTHTPSPANSGEGGGGDDNNNNRNNNNDSGGDSDDDHDDDNDDAGAKPQQSPSNGSSSEPFSGIQAPRFGHELGELFREKVDEETREAVQYYLDYFYPLAPMYHPFVFILRVVRGQVDPLLIDAIKATTARVIAQKTGRVVDGQALADGVRAQILGRLRQPTVDLVRTMVVMTLLAGSQGDYISYNSLICLAASVVVRMGWHNLDLYRRPPPASFEDWVDLELKRRLFWLVYQIDSYQSMLTGRPMSIAEDSVHVFAPCPDSEWDSMRPTRSIVPGDPSHSIAYVSPAASAGRQLSPGGADPSPPPPVPPVPPLRPSQHVIVATGAFSHSFMSLCELTAIIAKINTFLCDAKASRPLMLLAQPPPQQQQQQQQSGDGAAPSPGASPAGLSRDAPFPAADFLGGASNGTSGLVRPVMRPVRLASEYAAFVELDERLEEWKRNLLMPEDLRDDATEARDITFFGTADHRRFMMRVRYFCLHCYYVPNTIFLHQANRPTFFTEYEQPLEVRMAQRWAAAKSASPAAAAAAASTSTSSTAATAAAPDAGGSSGGDDPDAAAATERALRELLARAFSSTWNEGVLAYDIEKTSWDHSVRAAKGLSEHLQRNSDLPLERFDQVIPFCIFISVSVLLRQVRMCASLLRAAAAEPIAAARRLAAAGGARAVEAERAQCTACIRHQWTTLQSLGALWDIDGINDLLQSMQIDEVTKAASMLEGMSL